MRGYAEDRLLEALAAGVEQYVILGAGLDSFSMRQQGITETLQIFELDHPATQVMKRDKVSSVFGGIPANLAFVPVDFETDHLDDALVRADFDPQAPSFFSWLGTTYYLTKDAIRETLARIAGVAGTGKPHGSRLQACQGPRSGGEPAVRRQAGSIRGATRRAHDLHVHARGVAGRDVRIRLLGSGRHPGRRSETPIPEREIRPGRSGAQFFLRAVSYGPQGRRDVKKTRCSERPNAGS